VSVPYHDRPGSEDLHALGDGRNRVAVVTYLIVIAVGIAFWIVTGPRLWSLVTSAFGT
jgi:hypothetical protein